jgi:hypothetical protein
MQAAKKRIITGKPILILCKTTSAMILNFRTFRKPDHLPPFVNAVTVPAFAINQKLRI